MTAAAGGGALGDGDLRQRVGDGAAVVDVRPLQPEHLGSISWSGSRTHLDNVAEQLDRVESGEVVYLALFADDRPVCKGGIDFAKEAGAGTIWQVATMPVLEGLGLATRLIGALESAAMARGVRRSRLAVEPDNARAQRLYEYLGYERVGESEASWDAERPDGSRYRHSTRLVEMAKISERGRGERRLGAAKN